MQKLNFWSYQNALLIWRKYAQYLRGRLSNPAPSDDLDKQKDFEDALTELETVIRFFDLHVADFAELPPEIK